MNGGGHLDTKGKKRNLQDRFTQIYNEYKSSIYSFCLVKLNGDSNGAEDCMQNSFMVLYKKMKNDEEIVNPRAFLYKTASNYVLKCIEAKAKENSKIVPISEYEDKAVDNQSIIDSDIDYSILTKKLNELLNPDEQKLLKLKYIDDLTIEQVSGILNISKPAVAKRLQRLREKIKNSITIE
ncbi:MAG: sigma-70 family RNA polymerase sigma factor [Eubacterium sp.]|nr:sigma-70 family RNA polymerase sigma factor [Eubacterium sp.]